MSDSEANFSDWTEATHSALAEPNYSVVFKQNEVLRFDITISQDNWNTMQNDLDDNLNHMGPGPGGIDNEDYQPVWVPSSVYFNGIEWYNVGIRFKGNSSLRSAYQSGNNKLSLKLDFDEFEDNNEDYKNQRFYGFRQLNLNNNFDDASLMREKIGADMFRQFGLASAQTAFCVVYIDHGEGPQFFGVYTLVEEVDDTVLDSQFADANGNLYKPEGDAATFANGTYNESEFFVKTVETDYSDVRSLYDIINSSERISNTDLWKEDLESVFDVDTFIKWLAANTIIQNWDTYGIMSHNYYLYNNPSNDKLTWIPWDNNEAFQEGKQGGALSLSLDEVRNNWPLIRYLKDIDEYNELYENYLQSFIDDVFIPADMIATYQRYETLLQEYAYAEEPGYSFINDDSEFDQEVDELESHVNQRNSSVNIYLSKK